MWLKLLIAVLLVIIPAVILFIIALLAQWRREAELERAWRNYPESEEDCE